MLTRVYKGRTVEVESLERGFLYEGQVYKSLTAVAKAITGTHLSGKQLFGLRQESRS